MYPGESPGRRVALSSGSDCGAVWLWPSAYEDSFNNYWSSNTPYITLNSQKNIDDMFFYQNSPLQPLNNEIRLLPYANGKHINVLKHFVYVYIMYVWALPLTTHLTPISRPRTQYLENSPNSADDQIGNVMATMMMNQALDRDKRQKEREKKQQEFRLQVEMQPQQMLQQQNMDLYSLRHQALSDLSRIQHLGFTLCQDQARRCADADSLSIQLMYLNRYFPWPRILWCWCVLGRCSHATIAVMVTMLLSQKRQSRCPPERCFAPPGDPSLS